jgi:hypothetical protein
MGGRKLNEDKSGQNKAVSFIKARVKEIIRHYLEIN